MSFVADTLSDIGLDAPIVAWAAGAEDDFGRFFETCPRGEWLLRIGLRVGAERRMLVRAAVSSVRGALGAVPSGIGEPFTAVAVSARWAAGDGDAALCWAAAFAADQAADRLMEAMGHGADADRAVAATRAAALVAFACDADADPLYYGMRGYAADAVELATFALGGSEAAVHACAERTRHALDFDAILQKIGEASRSSQELPRTYPGFENAVADGSLRVDVGTA